MPGRGRHLAIATKTASTELPMCRTPGWSSQSSRLCGKIKACLNAPATIDRMTGHVSEPGAIGLVEGLA